MEANLHEPVEEFDIDPILNKLMVATTKGPGTMVNLEYDEILQLIENVGKVINEQPMLLRLKAPLVVGTDMHG